MDIPDEAWGNEITIVLYPTENNAFTSLPELKIFPAKTALLYFVDNKETRFLITFALLVFAIFGVFAFLLGGIHGTARRNGLCLMVLALLVSLWLISNCMLYVLFRWNYYFWEPLEYIAGYSIAIPMLLFFSGMEDKNIRWKKILKWTAAAITAFVAVSTVLNFTNILHYSAMMNMTTVLLIMCSLLLLAYSIRTRKNKSKTQKMLRTGSYAFILSCVYEILMRVVEQFVIVSYPSLITLGLFFLILYMVVAFISRMYDNQKDLVTVQVKADTLDQTIDNTPAGICQLIPKEPFKIISANDIFYRIMGYSDSDLQNGKPENAFARLDNAEKDFLRNKVSGILQGSENTGEFEFVTTDSSGAPQTILIRYNYERTGSGNITVSLLDITDRKQMEEELRLSEERYRLALSQSGKDFFYFDVPTCTMRVSQKMADTFGIPLEVGNMPEGFLSYGMLEKESEENYRQFFGQIISGKKTGETILGCHTLSMPHNALWYALTFVTVFGKENSPMSTIITYEDISEQHKLELQSKWKQLNLISLKDSDYVIAVYDLTQNKLVSQVGGLFTKMPAFIFGFDEINAFVIEHFFHEDDRDACRRFFDRERLLSMFRAGETEASIEYRSLQSGSAFRWTAATVSLIEDPYNHHVMLQIVFTDIHDSKTGEIKAKQNMAELQKELDNSRIKIMINQMQPHFLYNALSAIQTIVKVDPDYAYQLIYDFTVHLRSSIKALSSDAPIPFENEMENVKAYLNIEKMRFGDKMQVVYELACEDFSVIPLSIQPLAENAARHGLYPKGEDGGTVWVRSREEANAYVVEVEDDGEGFDVQEVLSLDRDSIGLKNLIFRLRSLMDADVFIQSEIGKGTLVRVSIPKIPEGVSADENDICG